MLLILLIIVFKSLLQMESLWLSLAVMVLVLDSLTGHGITIDTAGTGLVYVSEWIIIVSQSSLVMVCLLVVLEGKVVILISLSVPLGLRFDKKGFLYVCDYHNDRLVIY